MAKSQCEYKEIINGAAELYIGNVVAAVIPSGTPVGWVEANNINVEITPPTISGMICVGWIPYSDGGTYRVQSPHVKYKSSKWIVSAYIMVALTANTSVSFRPLYVKS